VTTPAAWPTSYCPPSPCFSSAAPRSSPVRAGWRKARAAPTASPGSPSPAFPPTPPSASGIGGAPPEAFDGLFRQTLDAAGPLTAFRRLDNRALIALDGTEHFCSRKLHCPRCLHRRRADGAAAHFHRFLGASLVAPGHVSLSTQSDAFSAAFDHGGRRETGRRQRVRVPYDEGRASRIGPESCVSDRDVRGEALTGEAMGQVLSHVTKTVRDADALRGAEGNTAGCAIASAPSVPRGLRPRHVTDISCTGTGRSQVRPRREVRSASGRPEGRSR